MSSIQARCSDHSSEAEIEPAPTPRLKYHSGIFTGSTMAPSCSRVLAEACQAAETGQPGFALLLVGLDRFSALNDALGHNGGDRVLIEVGMRLAAGVGPEELERAEQLRRGEHSAPR